MSPNVELLGNHFTMKPRKPQMKIATEGLQRAMSDLSFELSKGPTEIDIIVNNLPPICEVEDAKCECCGMSEECTPEYITKVKSKFCGKWICGLCSEAVKEELEKESGRSQEEALDVHMSACVRFNRFGRMHPVLYQAEAMREMLRNSSKRGKSSSPREKGVSNGKKVGIARSSSCIPAITRDVNVFVK